MSGMGNCYRAGRFGGRTLCVHDPEIPGVPNSAGGYVHEVANGKGNCGLFISDLRPAVRDEFRYIDGTGINQ